MSTGERGKVLVVLEDHAESDILRMLLAPSHDATCVDAATQALEHVAREPCEVVLTDLHMPEMDGMALLDALAERAPGVPVIMLTAHANVDNAVEAMKRGAADFLAKPFDRDEVLFTVAKALKRARHLADQPEKPRPPRDAKVPSLGESAAMREAAALIARAARASSTVLLQGESGSGKEVAARAIHAASDRADGPFVPVHCAALPENLLESELFGYEKGAFTGATNRKPGRVELAQGGTLFLDEIGDVTASVQVKLLRLLQEKEYQRLGGTESITADVRFVAATHRDLDAMVEAGEFREDLFYRLNVIPIWVAPLRHRTEDVAPLARRFCAEHAANNGRGEVALDDDAIARLKAQLWPGNVRELSNFVERLIVFTDGSRISAADVDRELDRQPRRASSPSPVAATEGTLGGRREEAEPAAIQEALERAGGNRTQAARLLGISRRRFADALADGNSGLVPQSERPTPRTRTSTSSRQDANIAAFESFMYDKRVDPPGRQSATLTLREKLTTARRGVPIDDTKRAARAVLLWVKACMHQQGPGHAARFKLGIADRSESKKNLANYARFACFDGEPPTELSFLTAYLAFDEGAVRDALDLPAPSEPAQAPASPFPSPAVRQHPFLKYLGEITSKVVFLPIPQSDGRHTLIQSIAESAGTHLARRRKLVRIERLPEDGTDTAEALLRSIGQARQTNGIQPADPAVFLRTEPMSWDSKNPSELANALKGHVPDGSAVVILGTSMHPTTHRSGSLCQFPMPHMDISFVPKMEAYDELPLCCREAIQQIAKDSTNANIPGIKECVASLEQLRLVVPSDNGVALIDVVHEALGTKS